MADRKYGSHSLGESLSEMHINFIAGELACPPEDCGGVYGYYECIRAIKNKDNSDGLITWLGRWRPDRFNVKAVKFENPRSRLKTGMGE